MYLYVPRKGDVEIRNNIQDITEQPVRYCNNHSTLFVSKYPQL